MLYFDFKKENLIILLITCIFLCLAVCPTLAQKSEYKIQSSDVLKISVHEQPDLGTVTRVQADGTISFPLIRAVYVKDLTVQEIESKIKELLEKDYLVSAEVIVFIEDYHPQQVSVIGEVHNPGKYDMPKEKGITLLEAIAMAGGFTKDADVNSTRIMRVKDGAGETIKVKVKDITEKGEKDKDITIEPDDVIFVPESFL